MRRYKMLIALIVAIVLISAIFFYNKEIKLANKNKAKEKIQEVVECSEIIWESSLDIIKMFLPEVNSEERKEEVTHVMLHFISNAGNNIDNPYEIESIFEILEEYELSTHYVIDREGQIYQFTPENRVAYHAGKGTVVDYPHYENRLNHHSIGIEIMAIGTEEEMESMISKEDYELIDSSLIGYTKEQYEAVNLLLDDLLDRHKSIKKDRLHILGHDEYSEDKSDPGTLFDWDMINL